MAKIIRETSGKMTHLCRKILPVNVRWSILDRVTIFQQFFHSIWDRILACYIGKSKRYRRLSHRCSSPAAESPESANGDTDLYSDLVTLKISLLGDCQTGKTSFVIKYVGEEQPNRRCLDTEGVNLMNKTLFVVGARICFSIWDVGGDYKWLEHVGIACKHSVAILFMFDLTSRCTLNSVIGWYREARKWNRTAIPIIIGSKFDEFVKLPPELQWTIISQARAYQGQ